MVVFGFKSSTKNIRSPLSIKTNGWYFISIIGSLNNYNVQRIIEKYPQVFAGKNKHAQGYYHYYLEGESYSDIAESKSFVISEDHLKESANISYSPFNEYSIHATDDWKAFPTCTFDGFYFNCKDISKEEITRAFSEPKVYSIFAVGNFELHCRYTTGLLQSNANYLQYDPDSYRLRVPRMLEQAGLDGEGQTVALYDSGLDMNHVFFYDPVYNVNGSVPNSTYNPHHRKIVKYEQLNTDDGSTTPNHGTFIAGMVIGDTGNNSDSVNQYAGWLPKGKAHEFFITSMPDPSQQLESLNETDTHILYMPFGSPYIFSAQISDVYDTFSYNNPDKLVIVSGGNNNAFQHPSTGVNVLCVTSTTYPETTIEKNSIFALSNGDTKVDSLKVASNSPLNNNYSPIKNYQNLPIVEEDVEGSIYLNKDCEKPVPTKASVYIVFNESCNASESIPTAIFNISDYDTLLSMGTASVNWTGRSHPLQIFFASNGPALNGIRKPDLAANGEYEISARSNDDKLYTGDTNYTATNWMAGASVSGAHITGMAAQMRQYFIDGYYPNGEKHSSEKIIPSGNLIKSILINSGKNTSARPEDYSFGYGIPYGAKALGFTGNGVRFIDNITLQSGGHVSFELTTTRDAELSVSMAYLDYPVGQLLTGRTFSTDVDLVVDDGTTSYVGNMLPGASPEEYSSIEKVIINEAKAGKYMIHLYCSEYNEAEIKPPFISIAVSGGFDTADVTTNPLDLKKEINSTVCPVCYYDSTCSNGKCICSEGHYGPNCAANYTIVEDGRTPVVAGIPLHYYRVNLAPSKYRLFNLVYTGPNLPGSAANIRITLVAGPSLHAKFIGTAPLQIELRTGNTISINENLGIDADHYYLYITGNDIPLELQFQNVPWETPSITPDKTPVETPSSTPAATQTPARTPSSTPSSTPSTTPHPTRSLLPTASPYVKTPSPSATADPKDAGQLGDDPNKGKEKKNVGGLVAGIVVGLIVVAAIIVGVILYIRKRNGANSDDTDLPDTAINNETGVFGNEYTNATPSYMWTTAVQDDDEINSDSDSNEEDQQINFFAGDNEW